MSTFFNRGRVNIRAAPVAVLMLAGGVWQQWDLQRLRVEHASLLDLARSRGIDPDAADALPRKPYSRRDMRGDAKELAAALIRRSEKGNTDRSDWQDQIDLVDQFEGLNPAQLREMIDIFRKDEQMPEQMRLLVTLDLLQRLGNDFPEEALGQVVEMDSWLPEGFARHHFQESISKIANRFGERSPDAAWKWYVDTWKTEAEGSDQVRDAVLGGIAKRDPGLALRCAEQAGGKEAGIFFLGFYCTSLDQRVAALNALRAWSGDDAGRKVKLDAFIQQQTLKQVNGERVRFEGVTSWIEQAGLTSEEFAFLGNRSEVDLSAYIDSRDTGKLIEWLDRTFPEKEATQQIKHLVEDNRTGAAAKTWLDALPPEQAAAINARLKDE